MQKFLKRFFDLIFTTIIGIFIVPIILFTMVYIKIKSPNDSPIFKQERIGYRNKPFKIIKLRTMTNDKDLNGILLSDEQRLKKWGVSIRKLSLDELSQIFNIFSGQMSWIGPRPLLPREMLVMTEEEQKERQSVVPGITGWEAVNEDKSDSRRAMAEFDLYYVRKWSIALDIKIFFMTFIKLFNADRSDEAHRAPMLNENEFATNKIVRNEE